MQGDVSKASDVERIFDETKKAFGKLDVLVNNAAVYEFAPIDRLPRSTFIASSTPTSPVCFWRRKKPSSTLVRREETSSISVRLLLN